MDESPILRTPYEEPATHYRLDLSGRATRDVLRGRRPSGIVAGMPGEDGIVSEPDGVEPHRTINGLRDAVRRWRRDGWPGTTAKTRRLLDFWRQSDPGAGMRPFWCQMEAVETIIWLFEAGQAHDAAFHRSTMLKLAATNSEYNDGVPRTAFKMATGSGKTNVMAMAMLWMLVNGTHRDDAGVTNFLVIAPNLTVKKRLEALDPKGGTELWDAITPREFHRILNRAQVTVVNFHVFQRNTATMDGRSLGAKERRMLGKSSIKNFRESGSDMIGRVLRGHDSRSKVVVINDEAHHCYKPQETRRDGEYREYQEAAALWFNALRILKRQDRLAGVYDFSATPMWLIKPHGPVSEVFPWTVSDFPLLDAIESGLVKIPRVPVEDDSESHQPRYRNVYEYNSGRPLGRNPTARVQEPLRQLYSHYRDVVNPAYERVGIVPVFIVVANSIKNAAAMYGWIAGGRGRNGGRGTRGHLELFSNYDRDGSPREHPPTLLVHSKLFDRTPATGPEKEMVGEQAALFGLDGSLDKKQEQIRSLFSSVGRGDARHVRCVISVGMLTEGWDAKNVTHVFGYRRFGSLLLCEQVTGRALRRTSFVGPGMQKPEYANIFGVPYTFARGGDVDPQPPVQPYRVFSVPERERFRISFPNVIGYENPRQRQRFRLNPQKIKPYAVDTAEPTKTETEGPAGDGITTRRGRREQTAIWDTASRVSALLSRDSEGAGRLVAAGRRIAFVDSCRIVREWLSNPSITCGDVAGMTVDPSVPQRIAEACDRDYETLRLRPVFADERQAGERFRTTEGVCFKTTLQHAYKSVQGNGAAPDGPHTDENPGNFLKKSELNRAACHSSEEAQIARVLDRHPRIEAWVRNFRLDFKIRWFDEAQNSWRDTDPDFVARVKTGDGRQLHLVIEFKGMKKGEAEERAKKYYMENWWCPAVSGYDGGRYGEWRSVWIEDASSAGQIISEACA